MQGGDHRSAETTRIEWPPERLPKRAIVVDTREQLPYEFPRQVRRALPAGDYSLDGYEDLFAVERKSLDDLVGTLTQGRARFIRELERLASLRWAWLLIETALGDIVAGLYKSQTPPSSVIGSVIALSMRYRVPAIYAGGRWHAQAYCAQILRRAEIELERETARD